MSVPSIDDLKKKLTGKHLLFDTNVLLEASKKLEAFSDFLDLIEELNCKPVYNSFIRFELLNRIYQPELRKQMAQFLKELDLFCLPLTPLDSHVELALRIAGEHAARGMAGIGIVDSTSIALLQKHPQDLVLVTRNIKDFTPKLLNRFFSLPIDIGSDVLTFSFYQWDSERAKRFGLETVK